MTEVGNIVTLEGSDEYLILEETTKNGVTYLYAVRVLLDETPTDEYIIFESIKKDDGEFLLPVSDKALYDELIEDFKDIVSNKILGIQSDSEE